MTDITDDQIAEIRERDRSCGATNLDYEAAIYTLLAALDAMTAERDALEKQVETIRADCYERWRYRPETLKQAQTFELEDELRLRHD